MNAPLTTTTADRHVRLWTALALVTLTVLVRLAGIADNSITQDESTMVLFARGVLERGYPFLLRGDGEFLISTYELVPYPIALSMALFGFAEWSVRLPAVGFAAATSLLILHFAARLFDYRTAVLATLLFAVLPWAAYWGANAFYPSQLAFFALLSLAAVHRLIVEEAPRPRHFYALLATMSVTYLTWEGAGALLPTFFVMLLVFRWGRWQWLQGPHAWTVATAMLALVIGQLTYRTVLREPFLGIVTGRSEIGLDKLAFASTSFDPYYYAAGLVSEAHLVLGACLALGLLFLRGSPGLRLLYLFLALYWFVLTSVVGYYALRYAYLTLPAVLIACAAVTVMLADRFAAALPALRHPALAALAVLHLSVATAWGLRPTEAAATLASVARPYELRRDLPGFSFRPLARVLKASYRAGDKVIVQAPFPIQLYTDMKGDYFLQSETVTSVYFEAASFPYYADKWVANPVLRNQAELDEVLAANDRVWFVAVPEGAAAMSAGRASYARLAGRMKLVAETADGRLYLWEHPRVRSALSP